MTKGELTQQRMVEAVIESVAKNGFEFTTATTISKMAKVNRGLIVHYFSTIEKLVRTATQTAGLFIITRTNELMLQHQSVEDPVERYFKATFGWIRERPHYGQFMLSLISRASYEKKAQEPVELVFESGRKRLKALVEEGVDKGLYKIKDPTAAALMLHGILVGNLMTFLLDPSKLDFATRNALSTATELLKRKK